MVGTSFGLSSFVLHRPLSEGLAKRESLSSVDPLRSDIDGQRARGSRALAQSVSKASSSRRRKNTVPDAPHHSVNATLAYLDLDGFRLRLLGFREMYLEHPVLEVGRHLLPSASSGRVKLRTKLP